MGDLVKMKPFWAVVSNRGRIVCIRRDPVAAAADWSESLAVETCRIVGPFTEPAGWQPIESAPRDGTEILAFGDEPGLDNAKGIVRQTRFRSSKGTPSEKTTDGWFWWSEPMSNWGSSWMPTHWMPLPAPPVTEQSEPANAEASKNA